MARAGMVALIDRVKALTGAGTAEYVVDSESYWSLDHIQDILDSNSTFVVQSGLSWQPQTIAGGTVAYYTARSSYRDLEESSSGTTRWVIRDGTGAEVGTANYTADYRSGRVTFTANQGGSQYYLTTYSYDVYAAAADVWLERLAHFQDWYDFSADNQEFTRDQVFQHAKDMEALMRQKAGKNLVATASGDLRVSQFVRVDIGR